MYVCVYVCVCVCLSCCFVFFGGWFRCFRSMVFGVLGLSWFVGGTLKRTEKRNKEVKHPRPSARPVPAWVRGDPPRTSTREKNALGFRVRI